ncbi:MAG TPA: hypothetical protein VF624_13580 [Tepidisphaeraceae bacterium]|jgi:hypothetical protein
MQTEEEKTHVPDTARSYERAQPEKESPEAKLTPNKPAGKDRPDDYSKQNASPNEKHK